MYLNKTRDTVSASSLIQTMNSKTTAICDADFIGQYDKHNSPGTADPSIAKSRSGWIVSTLDIPSSGHLNFRYKLLCLLPRPSTYHCLSPWGMWFLSCRSYLKWRAGDSTFPVPSLTSTASFSRTTLVPLRLLACPRCVHARSMFVLPLSRTCQEGIDQYWIGRDWSRSFPLPPTSRLLYPHEVYSSERLHSSSLEDVRPVASASEREYWEITCTVSYRTSW